MKLGCLVIALTALVIPPQRFTVKVDAVRVDVLVTDGNRPVTGLAASDFELRDNSVPQRIEAIAMEDVALSVMLALDTSESVAGVALGYLQQAASAVVELLAPADRAALMSFSGSIKLRAPWTSDRPTLTAAIAATEASGMTALHDAAYAALTLKDDQSGRALVLIFSDGDDTAGWLSGQSVLDIARRTEAVVYAVGLRSAVPLSQGYRVDFRSGTQPDVPNAPEVTLKERFLNALAQETGGKYIDAERSDRLRATFVQIVNEFRSRYLLTYTPSGVETGGWHALDVRLKGKKGKVQARRGYLR
jgi:VWFA-related protein